MHHRTGPYLYISVALAIFGVAVLFTVPIKSVRLLALRLVAFVTDLLILVLLTVAIANLLFAYQVIRPSAVTSMGIVWAWFLYFVLFDWRFGGTPGQLALGLRLRNSFGKRASFLKCLARNLLILLVPLIAAGRITGITSSSQLWVFGEWSTGIAVLALIPLSIAFCGGQSIPDRVLGTRVLPRPPRGFQVSERLTKGALLLSFIASLLAGIIFGFAGSLTDQSVVIGRKVPMPPFDEFQQSTETEARTAAALRPYLNPGTLASDAFSSDDYLQDIRVSSAIGRLPTSNEELVLPVECQESFRIHASYQIVRIQINPQAPIFVQFVLFQNLLKASDLYVKRPDLVVFEIAFKGSYGVFNIESSESYILCLTASDGKQENSLVDVNRALSFWGSISEPAFLLMGSLDTYSQVEKIPIWFD